MKKNNSTETQFVETFVLKNKRERSIFELRSKRKRINFFNKLCHRYDEIFDARLMAAIPPPNSDSDAIYRLLVNEGAGRDCYLMSHYEELDGKTMLLAEALHSCVGCGMPSVVICDPIQLAYFEAEQEVGPPPRFILKNR